MAESSTTNQEPDASPRHFVAFGRLIGGLLITTAGGFGLHYYRTIEVTTFAGVATVSGAILNLWGFVGTVLHPKATREDCFWAIAFLLLFCVSLAGNVYYNYFDYGVSFAGLEVTIGAAAFVLAWVVAILVRRHINRNTALTLHQRRLRVLVAGLLALPILWMLIRPPISAQYHVRTLVSDKIQQRWYFIYDDEHIKQVLEQPRWCARWALLDCLRSSDLSDVETTLMLIGNSRELLKLIEPDELLQLQNKLHSNPRLSGLARELRMIRIHGTAYGK